MHFIKFISFLFANFSVNFFPILKSPDRELAARLKLTAKLAANVLEVWRQVPNQLFLFTFPMPVIQTVRKCIAIKKELRKRKGLFAQRNTHLGKLDTNLFYFLMIVISQDNENAFVFGFFCYLVGLRRLRRFPFD